MEKENLYQSPKPLIVGVLVLYAVVMIATYIVKTQFDVSLPSEILWIVSGIFITSILFFMMEAVSQRNENSLIGKIFFGVVLFMIVISAFTYLAEKKINYAPTMYFVYAIAGILVVLGAAFAFFIVVVDNAKKGNITFHADLGLFVLPFALLMYTTVIFYSTIVLWLAAKIPTNNGRLNEFIGTLKSLLQINKTAISEKKIEPAKIEQASSKYKKSFLEDEVSDFEFGNLKNEKPKTEKQKTDFEFEFSKNEKPKTAVKSSYFGKSLFED